MQFTYVGVVAALVGVLLLLFRRSALFGFVVLCSLFGAASAVNLSALGDASIPPGYFGLAFLAFGLLGLPGASGQLRAGCRRGWPFLLYTGWAVGGAFLLPRMFQGAIELPPMKFHGDETLFFTVPLEPSSRNITQAVYIVGTCAAMLMAATAARSGASAATAIARIFLVSGLIHAGFGLLQLGLDAVGQDRWLDVFRNGNYAQVDQATGAFHRIAGVFNETSAFSSYGFFYFVFAFELWMRRLLPTLSGICALTLGGILLFTTSTSAYVGLAAFAVILAIRVVFAPRLVASRVPAMAVFGLLLTALGLVLVVLTPGFVDSLWSTILAQTVGKSGSESAVQRTYWARKGFEAFTASRGLGVGVGSFRSSSLLAAVIGSTGALGTAAFLLFAFKVLRPFDRETWDVSRRDEMRNVGVAAGWAAILGLAPSILAGASADPGLLFGLFAGVAVGWRSDAADSAAKIREAGSWRLRRGQVAARQAA